LYWLHHSRHSVEIGGLSFVHRKQSVVLWRFIVFRGLYPGAEQEHRVFI
jgi:hypothetical protein